MKASDARDSVRVGLVQMQCAESPDENMQKALAMTRDAISQGAQVICLPELFRSRYFCQSEDAKFYALAEPIPGPSTQLGKRGREIIIGFGNVFNQIFFLTFYLILHVGGDLAFLRFALFVVYVSLSAD